MPAKGAPTVKYLANSTLSPKKVENTEEEMGNCVHRVAPLLTDTNETSDQNQASAILNVNQAASGQNVLEQHDTAEEPLDMGEMTEVDTATFNFCMQDLIGKQLGVIKDIPNTASVASTVELLSANHDLPADFPKGLQIFPKTKSTIKLGEPPALPPIVVVEGSTKRDLDVACLEMGYAALRKLNIKEITVQSKATGTVQKRWYDRLSLSKNPRAAESARQNSAPTETSPIAKYKKKPKGTLSPPPTQQFGVSLTFIKENNANMVGAIPPVVRQCVEFLSQPDALETEGIFRRSANMSVIKELQRACNRGEPLRFRNDPHNAAVLLKTFFRDLEEPLLTFDLYDEIMDFQNWSARDKPRKVKILILERLPLDNYKLLKYVFQFLWKVQDRSCLNKMTTNNLAVVFGPNLAWPPNGQMSLLSIAPINNFTDFLLAHQESIFII